MRAWALFVSAPLLACGQDELDLSNRLDQSVGLELRAPKATLRGGCERTLRDRFCQEEYELIGSLDLTARDARSLGVLGGQDDDQCLNQVWIKLVRVGEVGPVDDPGTILELPVQAEIEVGAGALHGVAFPDATVRIDEVGASDSRQARPPLTCAEAGRTPRG